MLIYLVSPEHEAVPWTLSGAEHLEIEVPDFTIEPTDSVNSYLLRIQKFIGEVVNDDTMASFFADNEVQVENKNIEGVVIDTRISPSIWYFIAQYLYKVRGSQFQINAIWNGQVVPIWDVQFVLSVADLPQNNVTNLVLESTASPPDDNQEQEKEVEDGSQDPTAGIDDETPPPEVDASGDDTDSSDRGAE